MFLSIRIGVSSNRRANNSNVILLWSVFVTMYLVFSDFQLWALMIGIRCLYFKNVIGRSLKIDRLKCKPVFEYEDLVYTFAPLFSIANLPFGDSKDLFNMLCNFYRLICVILVLLSWLTLVFFWFHSTEWVFFSWKAFLCLCPWLL